MVDITKCKGENKEFVCPIRKNCYRFTSIPDEYRQSYFVNLPYNKKEGKCENFWEDIRNESKNSN